MAKIRVLFLVPSFLPIIGGVERHTYYVAKELSRHRIDVTIVTCGSRQLKKHNVINGIKVYRINTELKGPLRILPIWAYLLKNLQILIYNDIIHLHDWYTFLWLLPIFPTLRVLRKPVFITFHGFERYPIPKPAYVFRKLVEKATWGNICVGAFIAKWYRTKPDVIIIGGVEKPKHLPPKSNIKNNVIVFIGRLSNDTGIIELLDAIKMLRDKCQLNIELHICGDGPLKNYVKRFSSLNNLNVYIYGFVSDPWSCIAKARIVSAPGYLSMLEGMIARRLVISICNNPLKKDYFFSIPKINEMIILASNPEELAKKLHEVFTNNKSVNKIIGKAYTFAKKHSWKRVALAYLTLYKNKLRIKNKGSNYAY